MKTRLLSLATILCAFGAFNVQAETVADALEKCRNTDNSLKRLMCYDSVAKSLNKYEGSDAQIEQLQAYKSNNGNQMKPRPAPVAGQSELGGHIKPHGACHRQ